MPDSLCGMCLIASVAFNTKLRECGYQPKLKCGKVSQGDNSYAHAWSELDGKTYDITFKQYDRHNPLYIGEETFVHKVFTTVTEVEDYSLFCTWDEKQTPNNPVIKWFLERL